MSFTVTIEITRNFEVECSVEKVFKVLADVPFSVSHFPKVDKLVDLGDNSFRWEMDKIGIDKYYLQTVYACHYTDNESEGWVKWEPVPGIGNGVVRGRWDLSAITDSETAIDFQSRGELTVPLPGLMKFILSPIVTNEFKNLVDRYIENLKTTLNK